MELVIDFKKEEIKIENETKDMNDLFKREEINKRYELIKNITETLGAIEKMHIIEPSFLDVQKDFIKVFEESSKLLTDTEEIEFSLIEEIGEILGLLKKMKFHKHRELKGLSEKIILELGDFYWYYVANLRIIKKYSWSKIEHHMLDQIEEYEKTVKIGTNKKVQDFNKNLDEVTIGSYFAEVIHFVKTEYDDDFYPGREWSLIISENIRKIKERYKI